MLLTALIANEDGGKEWLRSNEGTKCYDYTEPVFVNAVTKLTEIWKTNASANAVGAAYADAANAFMSDQAAVICNGPWRTPNSWTVLLVTGLMDLTERM